MPALEVCLSPRLFGEAIQPARLTGVIDVLRATSAFCAVFDRGAGSILPVANLQDLRLLHENGRLTAAESGGRKVDFADFGNSPVAFLQHDFTGQNLAYTTSNGTKALLAASVKGKAFTACFNNLAVAAAHIQAENTDTLLVCSGWLNAPCVEDTLCAGALAERVLAAGTHQLLGDSASIALRFWQSVKGDLAACVKTADHYTRLLSLGMHDDLDYCFQLDTSVSLPVMMHGKLINASRQGER